MSKKHKKVCRVLNYAEYLYILVSTATEFVFISAFTSLVGISVVITSYAVGLKICLITKGIKKNKPIIKKKRKKHDKIVLLAVSELNSIKF